jgi:hypothetical protein
MHNKASETDSFDHFLRNIPVHKIILFQKVEHFVGAPWNSKAFITDNMSCNIDTILGDPDRDAQTGTFVQNVNNFILAAIFWLLAAIFLLYPLKKKHWHKSRKIVQ